MVVRIVLALGLQLSLSVALRAQVVCQVIENIGCPTITEQNCPDMNSCIPKPGFAKEQCTDDAVRKVAGATRHGVRPADPGESGHFAANHVGSNYCKQTRKCKSDCEDVGVFIPNWVCQWDTTQAWVDAGDNYVLLLGANACSREPGGPID